MHPGWHTHRTASRPWPASQLGNSGWLEVDYRCKGDGLPDTALNSAVQGGRSRPLRGRRGLHTRSGARQCAGLGLPLWRYGLLRPTPPASHMLRGTRTDAPHQWGEAALRTGSGLGDDTLTRDMWGWTDFWKRGAPLALAHVGPAEVGPGRGRAWGAALRDTLTVTSCKTRVTVPYCDGVLERASRAV